MNIGLLLKLLPLLKFVKEFLPKPCLVILLVVGIGGYFMMGYVDAKHQEVTVKIETQQTIVQQQIATNYKLTAQQLNTIVQGIKEMKNAVQKVNDKVWELSRDVNAK